MTSWLKKFKELVLKDSSIDNIYDKNISENYSFVEIHKDSKLKYLYLIGDNYLHFHYFRKLFKKKAKINNEDYIKKFKPITISFLLDNITLRAFKNLFQFSVIFSLVVSAFNFII